MGLSLRELKEELMAKQGYTITPHHNQLSDLKALVDDMVNVRSQNPPSSGSGSYSGVTCSGHTAPGEYNLSLGDISNLDIKGCSCHTVKDTTAYCRSRTYTCSCNSNTPTCTCNSRTPVSCDCQNRSSICSCHAGNVGGCRCQARTTSCECENRIGCMSNYITSCTCNSRTPEPCNCQSRTSSCGSRNTTSCTCNGRCACNSEKRFE